MIYIQNAARYEEQKTQVQSKSYYKNQSIKLYKIQIKECFEWHFLNLDGSGGNASLSTSIDVRHNVKQKECRMGPYDQIKKS